VEGFNGYNGSDARAPRDSTHVIASFSGTGYNGYNGCNRQHLRLLVCQRLLQHGHLFPERCDDARELRTKDDEVLV